MKYSSFEDLVKMGVCFDRIARVERKPFMDKAVALFNRKEQEDHRLWLKLLREREGIYRKQGVLK